MIKKRFFAWLIFIIFHCVGLQAQEQDSLRISLLTCSPGTEVYSLYGHTAIRVQDLKHGGDWVFNYGMFSFNTPNFLLRFVKGETDYELGVAPYPFFEQEYKERGSFVRQQVLNLTSEEAFRLYYLLDLNYQPQNRTYRYNYFYDNCTTRARDRIEESIDGKVDYPSLDSDATFRTIVHQFTKDYPWSTLGVDLCLGAEADKPIDARKQMFAPFYMLRAANGAFIRKSSGEKRDFVSDESDIVQASPRAVEKEFPFSPMQVAVFLMAVTFLCCIWEVKLHKKFWLLDIFWFGMQGLAGCIISFLFFFSEHPTVGSNYLIIILNPLPLLYLPRMIYCNIKHKKDFYHTISAVVLIFFILLWGIIPQHFPAAILPLALSLLMVSAAHIYLDRICNRIS